MAETIKYSFSKWAKKSTGTTLLLPL